MIENLVKAEAYDKFIDVKAMRGKKQEIEGPIDFALFIYLIGHEIDIRIYSNEN